MRLVEYASAVVADKISVKVVMMMIMTNVKILLLDKVAMLLVVLFAVLVCDDDVQRHGDAHEDSDDISTAKMSH